MQFLKKRRDDKTTPKSQVDQESIDQVEGGSEAIKAIPKQELLAHLDQLNSQFQEFEKTREGMRTIISSVTPLVPRLNENKNLLQKEMDKNRTSRTKSPCRTTPFALPD